MFFAEVTAPVMMWTSASSRTPLMPTGSLMPSWSSTMNSCGMTWMISRSIGIAIALAASTTRSTSAGADLVVLARDRDHAAAVDAADVVAGDAGVHALDRHARPCARPRRPRAGCCRPSSRGRPPRRGAAPRSARCRCRPRAARSPPFWSAMMHEILVVPMSSPTNVRVPCAMFASLSVVSARRRSGVRAVASGLGRPHDHLVLNRTSTSCAGRRAARDRPAPPAAPTARARPAATPAPARACHSSAGARSSAPSETSISDTRPASCSSRADSADTHASPRRTSAVRPERLPGRAANVGAGQQRHVGDHAIAAAAPAARRSSRSPTARRAAPAAPDVARQS